MSDKGRVAGKHKELLLHRRPGRRVGNHPRPDPVQRHVEAVEVVCRLKDVGRETLDLLTVDDMDCRELAGRAAPRRRLEIDHNPVSHSNHAGVGNPHEARVGQASQC